MALGRQLAMGGERTELLKNRASVHSLHGRDLLGASLACEVLGGSVPQHGEERIPKDS